ncbi:MAG: hypothetical protein IT509_09300 [Rhodocyclaceae bacterium]|nr:hypothetical protein [Rhodocyclaceae bacterium]
MPVALADQIEVDTAISSQRPERPGHGRQARQIVQRQHAANRSSVMRQCDWIDRINNFDQTTNPDKGADDIIFAIRLSKCRQGARLDKAPEEVKLDEVGFDNRRLTPSHRRPPSCP